MASAGTYKGVNVNQGTDAQIAAQVAAINAGQQGTVSPINPIQPTSITPTAIPLSALQSPATAPATTSQMPIPTAAEGAQSYIQTAVTDPYIAGLQQQASQAQNNSNSSLESLLREQLGAPTQAGLESQYYGQKGGVNDSTAALNDITNQITAEQVSTRHQIEQLQKNNPLGKGAEAIQQQVNDLNSQSLSRQADLAVTQLAAQGKVQLATAIADRAIDGIMQAETQKLSVLNTIYQNNKDLFDKADQRAYEVAAAERQSKADNQEFRLRSQFDEQIKQNDPLYQAQVASERRQANAPYSTSGGGTQAERQATAVASLQTLISSGSPLKGGVPVVDSSGFITPAAWNSLIAAAPSEGLSRQDFINQFGYLLYTDKSGGIPSSYKITPQEKKLITGSLDS